jgi:hypothetical protein
MTGRQALSEGLEATMRSPTSTGLYWSKRGKVLCGTHFNDVSDDCYATEGWQPIPDSAQGVHGRHYQCVRCSGSPIEHRRRLPKLDELRVSSA